MKPDPLDELLRAYANQPVPPPSPQDKASIWHRIDSHAERRGWFGLGTLSWRELFAEPRMAVAGLVLALVTGVVPVAAAAGSFDTPERARDSLHFKCFTQCPSCLAGTMTPDQMGR